MVLPILITLGMFGTEIAYMASVDMRVSQLAISLGDNASRLGQTDNSAVTPTITEGDISSIMMGAVRQGAGINFQANGRAVLSSLEKHPTSGKQYIHWQRCVGGLNRGSEYGNDTDRNGLTGNVLNGMGRTGNSITATSTTNSVMFVEVYYEYDSIFGDMFVDGVVFKQEAAFLTRDDRNLTPGITGTGGDTACT